LAANKEDLTAEAQRRRGKEIKEIKTYFLSALLATSARDVLFWIACDGCDNLIDANPRANTDINKGSRGDAAREKRV
jgi:hypothetical protein